MWDGAATPSLTEPLTGERRSGAITRWLRRRVRAALPDLAAFIDGTILFILSREWHDIIAINILRLHPLPFCAEDASRLPCTTEAPANQQAIFAASVLVASLVLQSVAARLQTHLPSLRYAPHMLGYLVGWTTGFASIEWLAELISSAPSMHPVLVGTSVSAAASLLGAVLIGALQPTLHSRGACGGACGAQWCDAAWRLTSRGIAFAVMMLWNATLFESLYDGVPQYQRQGPLFYKMLFFCSLSLTAACSLVNVQLVRWRRQLVARAHLDRASQLDRAPLIGRQTGCCPDDGRPAGLVRRSAALVHLALLLEQAFGYVVGSVWTRFVVSVTTLETFPSALVAAKDTASAVGLTAAAALWLLLVRSPFAAPDDHAAADGRAEADGRTMADGWRAPEEVREAATQAATQATREAARAAAQDAARQGEQAPLGAASPRELVEVYYLTTAISYFVSWAWLSVLRDLSTLVARVGAHIGPTSAYLGDMLCVCLFGPILTLMLVRGRACALGTAITGTTGTAARAEAVAAAGAGLPPADTHRPSVRHTLQALLARVAPEDSPEGSPERSPEGSATGRHSPSQAGDSIRPCAGDGRSGDHLMEAATPHEVRERATTSPSTPPRATLSLSKAWRYWLMPER